MRKSIGRAASAGPAVAMTMVLGMALGACGSTQSPPPSAERKELQPVGRAAEAPPTQPLTPARRGPLRIALLAPLSGDFSDAGRDLVNGAAMAVFEAPDAQVELNAYDTHGDAEGARAALEAANAARADVVIGPLFGRNAQALAGDLAADGLAALAFSNDGAVAGPNIAVMGRSAQAETARIIGHAAASGARTVAIFGKRDRIGEAVAAQAQLEAEAGARGLYVRPALYDATETYTEIAANVERLLKSSGDSDALDRVANLKTQLDASVDPQITLVGLAAGRPGPDGDIHRSLSADYQRLIAAGSARPQAISAVVARYRSAIGAGAGAVDAVLLTVGGGELSTVAPMFQLYDAELAGVRLLGLTTWEEMDPARARELHGGRFPEPIYSETFAGRYAQTYGGRPSDLAAVAYDAVRLALAAAGPVTPRPTPMAALIDAGPVDGAHGQVRLSAGGLALRPLEIVEMQATGLFQVEPASIVEPARRPPAAATVSGGGQRPITLTPPPS